MQKYVFRPYSKLFPALFEQEKQRIAPHLKGVLAIEHVGSTAVCNLGGKGIIDIAIAANPEDLERVSEQLQQLGYEFRPLWSTSDRLYLVIDLPDPEEGKRRYHIHVTVPESRDWKRLIGFRDYLRNHPEEARNYAEMKREAALAANQEGAKYREIKEAYFKKVFELIGGL